jgi:hypothetical protein
MPLSPDERRGLDRARAHYRAAVAELPAGRYGHMRSILKSFILSIDDEIGLEDGSADPAAGSDGWHTEPEVYPGRDAFVRSIRRANTRPELLDDDAEMPYGHVKADGEPDERELAHAYEPPPHGRGEC